MIKDVIVVFFIFVGTFFMVMGSIGLLRFPDLYTRLHALTKSATLGLVGLLLADAIFLQTYEITIKVILGIAFHFITNPVGAHMIARAAYHRLRVPFWENTEKGWGPRQ